MKKIVLVALLAAAGCSKKATSDCDASISKGLDNFSNTVKSRTTNEEMKQRMATVLGTLRTTLVKRCTEDKWPTEVTKCFETVANMRDMQTCQTKLSTEQHEKVRSAIRDVMMGGGHMGGDAAHPAALTPNMGAAHGAPGSADGSAAPAAGSAAPAPAAPAPAAPAPAAPAAGSGSAAAAGGW